MTPASLKRGFTFIRTRLHRNLAANAVRTRLRRNLVNVHGFTFIELLIVIVIIALLAVVVFVALDPATRFADARNSRRWKDVNNLLTAVHECFIDNGGSYTICGLTDNNLHSLGTDDLDLSDELLPYLKEMPMDPLNGTAAVTGYSIQVDSNNIVTISSDNPENGITVRLSR